MSPDVNWTALQFGLSLVQLVGLVMVGVYTWWVNRGKAAKAAIESLERRVSRLEDDLRHQPSRGEVQGLSDRISELHSDLQELLGSFRGVQRAVDLMHQHLLDRSGK